MNPRRAERLAFANRFFIAETDGVCYTFADLHYQGVTMMKLYAPKYYTSFACVADRCRHTCCVGWEIDVDADTLQRYRSLNTDYGKTIVASIAEQDTPHFRLCEGERCPHLNKAGLCRIIMELGEDYLCDICREHPRFYNDSPCGKEVGLGMACQEACRLILGSEAYGDLIEIGETDGEAQPMVLDTVARRQSIYAVLSDNALPYVEKLHTLYRQYDASPAVFSDGEWRTLLASLEYLDEAHKADFSTYSSDISTPAAYEKPLERALAYFVFRHGTERQSEEEYRAALGFCLFCERLLASVVKSGRQEIAEAARIISEELEYSAENTEAIQSIFLFGME